MRSSQLRLPRVLGTSTAVEEIEAERSARSFTVGTPGALARPMAGLGASQTDRESAPASVDAAIEDPGQPLGAGLRSEMESHHGAGLGDVRVHTGGAAERSVRDVDALAYSVGNHVVLGSSRALQNRHLMAHEVAHVVGGDRADVVRRYRPATATAFGELDTATLKEQSFNAKTDIKTKPWIELITVKFGSTGKDADGNTFWTGSATAEYHANPAKLSAVSFTVTGGSSQLGKTDAGDFTVHRIEGYGYNSGSASGTPGVDFQWSEREGPNKRYTKKDSTGVRAANMSFAVFYNKGEALHVGPLDFSSHGCVHVDWTAMQQVNYHSVIGLTKVKVSYPAKP